MESSRGGVKSSLELLLLSLRFFFLQFEFSEEVFFLPGELLGVLLVEGELLGKERFLLLELGGAEELGAFEVLGGLL